ncbi:MarR family transcriptional regulator [Mucilaginibacter robiniae]|uniref:MarR family transcriptional regulator n=1 Tax=Mucilaginibacter robiniae TaxID=2728022 RepID=A0A7L5E576_9SPHI|nr:MarR family transcriptional regulator [Mucilaginibacter robiniae]QJD97459.1 MarR family transcriptional regulator [Mucilaginibacter robiniae]
MTVATKAELCVELGKAMNEMRHRLRQHVQVKMREHNINLTFEMMEVLSCLWKKNGINQQEIAYMSLKDKSSMTYLIDNLVKRNLVTRVEDESDRRNKLIYLTEDAQNLKDTLFPWVTEMYTHAASNLQEEDIINCTQVINAMVEKLK